MREGRRRCPLRPAGARGDARRWRVRRDLRRSELHRPQSRHRDRRSIDSEDGRDRLRLRSEEHTSELQSLMRISYAVFCLKKKKTLTYIQQKSISVLNNKKRRTLLDTQIRTHTHTLY